MYISLQYLIQKYDLCISGIIHIGAHLCEEKLSYNKSDIADIIWIEGNPEIYSKAVSKYPSEKIYNIVLSESDSKESDFYICNNSQCSSLLKLNLHKRYFPNIKQTNVIKTETSSLESFLKTYKIDVLNYNFLNLDTQGTELQILKGLNDKIQFIDYIYTEVNTDELYTNCSKLIEIDTYLQKYNFKRVETYLTSQKFGDAFYVREK
jgi:FkbM family methyltransferase